MQERLVARDDRGRLSLWNLYLLNPLTPIVLGLPAGARTATPVQDRRSRCCPDVSIAWSVGVARPSCSSASSRCCCAHLAARSSGCRATSRRNCDRGDRGRGRLQGLPAVPRASEQREAAPARRRAPRPRTSGRSATSRSTVEQGSSIGLIGHNGSGKTTLLKCIAGILRPTDGRDPLSRAHGGPARAGGRLPPGAHRPRERLPQRVVPGALAHATPIASTTTSSGSPSSRTSWTTR